MPKLIHRSSSTLEEWELGSFLLTIGRHADSNIRIDDAFVSLEHAVVGFGDGQYYVEDLGSSSGTRVNDQPVQRQVLQQGDVIGIGQASLLFEAPPPVPRPTEPEGRIFEPAAVGATTLPGQTDLNLLDQLVGSIRSHRDREQREREERQARLRAEWERTVTYAEQLKLKVRGDPRVRYFEVSRRNNDVMIRVQRSPDQPIQFLLLSMEHPDEKGHALSGVWLRRNTAPDRCYPGADEALAELIRELAFLIA